MRLYQKVLAILAIVIPLCQNIHASTCDSTSLALMEQTWREFRAIHPFGFQTVGLKHEGDTCIFVISEPAEWVKTEDLVALFTKYDGHLIECIQPYGYDGELHDYVGCLRKDRIDSLLFRNELFNLLYRTDYKAYYTDLNRPAKHVYFSNKNLNFNINSSNLRMTLFNESFKVSNKKFLAFNDLMKSKNSSNRLYFSKERGFVVWVLDSVGISQSDSVFLKTARKFALDTDIILGSIYEEGKVAVIGREREVSINILPPLRSETIRQLLTCNNRPQALLSIRRMSLIDDPFNLAFPNHPWLVFNSLETDSISPTIYYAPVSMSKMVRNAELGNLMYLTDIILKSWCENGKVNDLFINYPYPQSFPYPNGVTNELGDILKVNWKMFDPLFAFIYNTGCCFSEISSFSTEKDSIQKAKEIKISCDLYSYFAKQQCVDLIRIKQYSILLDAFRNLPVRQSEIQETNQLKTPSVTVSNKKWLYGGYLYQGQVVKQVVKGATQRAGQVATQRAGQVAAQRAAQAAAQRAGQVAPQSGGLVLPPVPKKVVTPKVAPLTPFQNLASKFRKDIIHPQPNGTKRGFDPKTHNATSKNLLLSVPEKRELLDKSDKEKKMMDDLRIQLRQFNIPVKVILNEQRIIIHAINILNNYDKGYEYEWAA